MTASQLPGALRRARTSRVSVAVRCCANSIDPGAIVPWPGKQPRFRLHEPGADEEKLLQGLPSIVEVNFFAKRWGHRIPCPDPWAPVEGLYILSLYSRAGHRIHLGRYPYKRLIEHVLWTTAARPQRPGEEGLSASQILLAAYALALFKQKDIFKQLLPPLREAMRQTFLDDEPLEPQEVGKLAWMFPSVRLGGEMLPEIGDLAMRTPNMRLTHLAQVASGLARAMQDDAGDQLITKLEQLLEKTCKSALGDLTEIGSGDVEALMNCFSLLPPGNPAVQLLPTLLSSILQVTFPGGECLSPRAKVLVYRCYQDHRDAFGGDFVATAKVIEGLRFFQEILQDLGHLLVKAAREGSPPWAVARPEEYRQLVQELNISGVDLASTHHLFRLLDIETDWELQDAPQWEKAAEQLLDRLLEVPFLEANPVPERERTSGFASWTLSSTSSNQTAEGSILVRSGHHGAAACATIHTDGSDRSVKPLVPLAFNKISREYDCEIQALAHVLREAQQLESSSLSGTRMDSIQGRMRLLVDQVPCISCMGAMAQFQALLPQVKLHCHFHRFYLRREVEREQNETKRRGNCYSLYEGGKSRGHAEGRLSFSHAIDILREMLRAVSAEEEEEFLTMLGGTLGAKPGQSQEISMPLSVMLPTSGTFHALIRLAVRERYVKEALGILAYMRRKEMNIFARSLAELAMDPQVPPRLAVKLMHEMELLGLPASQSLLSFLVLRLASLELPEPQGRGAVSFLRQLCSHGREEESAKSLLFKSKHPGANIKKMHLSAATVARCITMASPELWPRWGRTIGIWAEKSQEDPSVPFRALMDLIGITKGPQAVPSAEYWSCEHQKRVLHALNQTGLLERMLRKQVLTEAETSLVREIQADGG